MKSNAQKLTARLLGLVCAVVALTGSLHAQNGTWTSTTGGSWTNFPNWSGNTIASGSGNTADFSTLTLASSPVVTLDTARPIGNLTFGDVGNVYNWTLSAGSGAPALTLIGGTPTITVNNQNATNSLVLAGSAGLIKAGGGNLVLSGANTFTGTTTVNAGNLTLSRNSGGSGTLATTTLTINPGASVTATIGNALGYSAPNWVRTVNIYGGTYTNTASGADACWEVTFNLMGGTLASGPGRWAVDNNAASAFNTIATNVTSTFSGAIQTRSTSGSMTFNVAPGTATPDLLVSAAITIGSGGTGEGIVKTGAGVMSLTGGSTFTGGTIVSNGVLQLAGSGGSAGTLSASAVTVYAPGELQLNTGDGLGYTYAAARTLALMGGTMREVGAYSETLGRPTTMSNATITAKSGAGNTAAGYVGDCYNLFNATAVVTTATNSTNYISLPAGCQFALRGGSFNNAPGSFLIVNGVVTGYGGSAAYALTKAGAGTMILNSNNTYTGATVINGGTLEVDGSTAVGAVAVNANATLDGLGTINGALTVQSGGTLLAGTLSSIGTLSVSNALTFSSGCTNIMRISKNSGVTVSDLLQGMISVGYAGTLTVTNITSDANQLAPGDTFQLFNSLTYSGGFDNYNLPALANGWSWDKSQLLVNGTIKVISGSTPPSFNPPGGGYVGAQSVTISSDAGSTIYYTTDGSDPTTSGTRISGASPVSGVIIPVNTTETLMAYATNTVTHAAASPVVSATYITVPTAIWTNLAGGTWSVPANWTNGAVPNGSGVTADFSTLTLTGSTTVTLASQKTIGTMLFEDQGNAYGWVLNGTGPLIMDAGASVPSIVVSNQGVNISVTLISSNGLAIFGVGGSPAPGVILSSANNNFTNLTLSGVSVTNSTGGGSTTCDLGAKAAASTITVNSNATLNFTINNIFGGGGMNATNLPTLVIKGLVYSTRYNAMPNIILNGGTLGQAATDGGNYQGYQFLGSLNVVGSSASTISTDNGKTDDLLGSGTMFNVAVTGAAGPDLTVSAPLANASTDYGASVGFLIKTGAGTMSLAGYNTYTGATIVSNGTLEVDGSIGAGPVAINGGIVNGIGTIAGVITLNGGTLSAGTAAATGALSINNTLSLSGGTTMMRINKTGGSLASDLLQGITSLTYGGILTVTNITSDANLLVAGDTFQLFSANSYSGVFATLNLPALPTGLFWNTASLTTSGQISVTDNPPTPVFNPTAGGYVGTLTVTISSAPGSTIHYTTDDSDPQSSGTVISSPTPATVVVPVNTPREQIIAYATLGAGTSAENSATYSTVAIPTWITPGGGSWSGTYNWSNNVVANGFDVTADFSTQTLGGDSAVTLDIPATVGNMSFADQGNAYNWIIEDGGVGPLTLASSSGSSTITVNNQTNTINAVLTGTNGLVKAGAGTLVLANFDSYTGNTIVNAGNLILATNNTGRGTINGTLTVNNGATATATANNALGYTNTTNPRILWVQNLNLYGGTFNSAGTSDEGWGLQINMMGGTLAATGTGAHLSAGQGTVINTIATNVTSVISGTINTRENNPSNQIPFTVASSGGVASPDLLVSGSINAQTAGVGITKNGPGVMSLANTNSLSGPTIVSNGILRLQAGGGSVGTLANSAVTVVAPGELQLFTGDSLGYTYSATRTLTLLGGTLREINTNSESLARPTIMSNATITANASAGLTAGGAILAQGQQGDCFNLYGATAVITTATNTTNYLSLPAGCNFALRGGSFNVADGSVLIANCVLDGWSGSSSYALIKNGPGTMILNSNNTYTGSTVVSNGTLRVDGSTAGGAVVTGSGCILDGGGTLNGATTIQAGGTLQPGTLAGMGTLSISNVLTLNSGSTNVMRFNKAGAVFTSDLLQGMLTVSYGGNLVVTATGDPLVAGDSITLFKASTYSGTFDTYDLPALTTGLSWDKSQLLVNGSIRVISGTGTPAFNPPGGTYVGAQSVTISSDAGSTIFYTTDGSDPTMSGTRVSGASPISGIVIPVSTTETLRAYATNSGTAPSLLASATYVTVPTAIWTNTTGGSWPIAANWYADAVGNGSGITADFSTLTLAANTTVTLSSPETIGTMLFQDKGNTYGWTLSGTSPLTLDAGAAVPSIVVSNQSVVVTTPLAGTNGLVKAGAGSLVLTNFMTYTGNTIVNAGNLALSVGGGSGTLSSRTLTINPGASVTATVANALGYSGTAWVTNLNLNGSTFTTAIGSTNVGDQGWGLTVNLMGGTLASVGTNSEFSVGGGWVINTIATNVPSTIAGTCRTRNAQPNNQIPFNVAAGAASPDLLVSAVINNYQTGDGIVKTGAGVMRLTATNTYDGSTIVSNGTLEVDGSIAGGGVTVSGGMLSGAGTIAGAVTVSGGTLAAGTAASIGTLTINNTLDLSGGAAVMRINKTGSVLTNDNVQGLFGLTYGNLLTVTATGNALSAGDKFKLFYSPAYNGGFSAFNLPALAGGLTWDTSKLTVDGSIQVVTGVNTTPPTITNSITSGSLTLSWPADHTGWRLLVQTNNLAAGVSANTNDWMTVTGSAATNQMSLPIDATKRTEFYKLVYP